MIKFEYPEGATPLDPDEIEGLLLPHITTRGELDRWEQDNINEALKWLEKKNPKEILNEPFIKLLHKKMFDNVWKWAGKFRLSNKNIGVFWENISIELKKSCDDAEYWIKNKIYSPDEIGARFHHQLVYIHLFLNGNGRHARLMTDLLLENTLNHNKFSWGGKNLTTVGDCLRQYIQALKAADKHNYCLLIKFVRS